MVSNANVTITGSTFTTVGNNPQTGTFSWQTNANSIGYWNFTITISDNNCPVPSVQVIGFTINVFGVDIAASDYTFCPGTPQAVQLDAMGADGWGGLAEVALRGRFNAVNAVTELGDIEVYLKDPFLGPQPLDQQREVGL